MILSISKQLSLASTALAVAGFCVPTSQAVVVTVGGSEIVFNSNGFEGDTVSANPANANATGTYQFSNTAGVFVTSGSYVPVEANGPTSAYSGSKYLILDRDAPSANANSWLTMQFTRNINPVTESFTVQFAQWGTTLGTNGESTGMSIGDATADGTASGTSNILTSLGYNTTVPDFVSFTNSGSQLITSTGGAKIDTVWSLGAWNEVTYNWNAGSQTATLIVNGSSFNLINQLDNPAAINQFHIRVGSATSEMYIDAIPEPSSLALVGLGGLMMFRRKKA